MPCECNIIFNNNNFGEIFYSGQILSGTAVVTVSKTKIIKGVHVIIKGYSKVKWNEGQFKICEGNVNYLGKQIYLYGDENSKPFELSAGSYKFPFQFHLPDNLPSSIKTKFGRTNYNIILTVVRPVKLNTVLIKSFRVEYPLDLKSNPSFQEPITHVAQCNSWWSPCGPQIITARLATKSTSFQIGKPLPFQLIVENDTTYDCGNVIVKLRKLIRHLFKDEAMVLRNTIADKSLGAVRKLSVRKFDDYIDVPITQSSSIKTCQIIEICYVIQIVVTTPNLHEDLLTVVPVVLGISPVDENPADVVNTRL